MEKLYGSSVELQVTNKNLWLYTFIFSSPNVKKGPRSSNYESSNKYICPQILVSK